MSWLSQTFSSSIGKKLLMALTGLFLCSFLVVHLIGNLQLLKSDGGESFNQYALFMTTFPVIKVISYLLYASIIGHAVYGIMLTLKNKQARPVQYQSFDNKSVWMSRNMGILGTLILVFIVAHMKDFWAEYHFEDLPLYTLSNGVVVKDLYLEVKEAFESIGYVVFYEFSMLAVAFHLYHGFQSAFQTLGLNHKKYTPGIKLFGAVFSIVIPAGYMVIPIWIYLGL